MKSLTAYLNESLSICKLSENDKNKLLFYDDLFKSIAKRYHKDKAKYITNIDEEFNKFMIAKKSNSKYFPLLKFETKNKYAEDNILNDIDDLLGKFYSFDCFLSKYYIEILLAYKYMIKGMIDPKNNYLMFNNVRLQQPSMENYNLAIKTIKEHPYVKTNKNEKNIDAEEAKDILCDYLDDLKWNWDVKLKDNMQPRMAVGVEKLSINKKSNFSEIDIESLKAHEIDGHIGRRYYGYKTGLYLFVEGLLWRNTLDEGLAIYNSLHKCENPKPNILFNIALKTIIAYNLNKKDFCELFDMCKELAPNLSDKIIFKTLLRFKRELQDCSIIGGNGDDMSYFCGYQIVKNMTDEERDDILKYNIGLGQIPDLPKIKEFLKVNKFKPLI